VYNIHVPTSISFFTDISPADIAQCMASGKCERQKCANIKDEYREMTLNEIFNGSVSL
jgi:hypothetical protein